MSHEPIICEKHGMTSCLDCYRPTVVKIELEPTPEEFWASLTPSRRLALAKAAPSYASKWGEVFAGDSEHEFRGWHHDTPLPGYVEKQSNGRWHAFCFGELYGSYKRRADAKSAVDAELIRLGYVLDPGE